VLDAAGRVWFNEFGTNKLGSIDPSSMTLSEHILPRGTRDRRIAIIGDGGIWYGDYARGFLARFDPKSGSVREWQTPGGASSLPYAMTDDDRGRIWLVETGPQPNRMIGFDPKSSRFFSITPVPSGAGTVRNMIFDRRTRQIWFGTDANTIGRARVP
jgi:virginiamycin B lyase